MSFDEFSRNCARKRKRTENYNKSSSWRKTSSIKWCQSMSKRCRTSMPLSTRSHSGRTSCRWSLTQRYYYFSRISIWSPPRSCFPPSKWLIQALVLDTWNPHFDNVTRRPGYSQGLSVYLPVAIEGMSFFIGLFSKEKGTLAFWAPSAP